MRNNDLISIFEPATLHEREPVPKTMGSAYAFKFMLLRFLLKCGWSRKQIKAFQITSPDIGSGIITLVIPKPFGKNEVNKLERFLQDIKYARDLMNGFSEIDPSINEAIAEDDDYNDLSVRYDPDAYIISGNFSEFTSAFMNYLSEKQGEDLSPYEDDYSFNRTHVYAQQCFNLAYGYKPN